MPELAINATVFITTTDNKIAGLHVRSTPTARVCLFTSAGPFLNQPHQPRILCQQRIAGEQGKPLHASLRHQHTIEGIAMHRG